MKDFSRSQKGAASVLVVFMMILLVTFGSMALSAALSNQRLGSLSTAWLNDYYRMDQAAELGLFEIDKILAEAEQKAQNQLQQRNYAGFAADYADEVRLGLTLAADQHEWELIETPEGMRVTFTITGETRTTKRAQNKYLTVEIASQIPLYERTENGWKRKENTSRFTIERWQEWQETLAVNDDIEFWDGKISQ